MKYKKLLIGAAVVDGAYVVAKVVAKEKNKDEERYLSASQVGTSLASSQSLKDSSSSQFDIETDENRQAEGDETKIPGIYEAVLKPALDKILSFGGLVILSPLYGAIALAIKIDDPGSVFFTQKRVGKDRTYFYCHKFRTMKSSTPHDVPTHQLEHPEQYITRVGRWLRMSSLDELPQVWDIFRGKMSVIGPRPALWNQDDLISSREQYGANDVLPGLTGLAQISGRDELEISDKARLDGEYVSTLRAGDIKAVMQDLHCFIKTIGSVAKSDGIVEGGTGNMKEILRPGVPVEDPETVFGCDMKLIIGPSVEKCVLITGAGSYIGESFRKYASRHYPSLTIDSIDMVDGSWRDVDFSGYDCVYHVAGIAHADVGKSTPAEREKYYAVNTDLAIETARKAKAAGCSQFIFMSSMIIYGESAPYGQTKMIDRHTRPSPANFYGDSKWQADKGVRSLSSPEFNVAVLRPPVIYGRGSKGNYPALAKLAKTIPVFPNIDNQRSMLHIDNLCEFLCKLVQAGAGGVWFPQNSEYVSTSRLVREIGITVNCPTYTSKILNPAVAIAAHIPGKVKNLANKVFGNSAYAQALSRYDGLEYQIVDLRQSIILTEGEQTGVVNKNSVVAEDMLSRKL